MARRNTSSPLEILWRQNVRLATTFLIASFIIIATILGIAVVSMLDQRPSAFGIRITLTFVLIGIAMVLFQLRARASACAHSCAFALHLEKHDPQLAQAIISKSECLKNADKILADMLRLMQVIPAMRTRDEQKRSQ